MMRVRALTLFRSANKENQTSSAVSARQPVRGISARNAVLSNSVFQPHGQLAAEHSARRREVEAELTRVRSELNEALNSGKSAEYRAEKMALLFPKVRELETKVAELQRINPRMLDYLDQIANEEPVKATLLKT